MVRKLTPSGLTLRLCYLRTRILGSHYHETNGLVVLNSTADEPAELLYGFTQALSVGVQNPPETAMNSFTIEPVATSTVSTTTSSKRRTASPPPSSSSTRRTSTIGTRHGPRSCRTSACRIARSANPAPLPPLSLRIGTRRRARRCCASTCSCSSAARW